MAKYLAKRIYNHKLDYQEVVEHYPNLKDDIDTELAKLGWEG